MENYNVTRKHSIYDQPEGGSYNIIIFDLDGTLSNSKEGITKCVQFALKEFGIYEEDLNFLEHFIGPPLTGEFMKAYNFTLEQAQEATKIYRQRYEPTGIYETDLYPGVKEMLEKLKADGKTIALATSKPQEMAEEVLKYLEIKEYFDYIMGAERTGPRQSKTDVLLALFDEMNIREESKEHMVLVGDTCFDVNGAMETGIDCIGVSYGFGRAEEMMSAGAITVVKDTTELLEILEEV